MNKQLQQGLAWMFAPPQIDRSTAILRTERISALTHLMSSAEHLARPEYRRPGGLNNWEISRDSRNFKNPVVRRTMDLVGDPAVTEAMHVARLAAAGLLLGGRGGRRARLAADILLTASSVLMYPRNHYGTDGSDQASFLTQFGVSLARLTDRPAIQDAALWGIGLQGVLSYTVSGWAKLAGPTWRKGKALEGVTRTMTYGAEPVWKLIHQHPVLSKVVGASVLALECAAPLAMWPGGRLARPFALATSSMHLGIAGTMALGRFVPSFLALHPSMSYIARSRATTGSQPGGGRQDLVPRVAGTVAAGAIATGLLSLMRNRRTIRSGRGDEQSFTTSDGATLTYRRSGHATAGAPVILFENALIGTPEHWEWLVQNLGADHEVVTYDRVDYGTSKVAPGVDTGMGDLAQHAAELAGHVAQGRPVAVVGHSLGGYLALLTAALPESPVSAVVLVDSSHPAELRRSPRQAAGAEILAASLPLVEVSLKLGCAPLLPVADWVKRLPKVARRLALARFRDSSLWTAGRKEWTRTSENFETAEPPKVPCPVLTLTAQGTVNSDPLQDGMHAELAGLGSGPADHRRIAGATHDTIVTEQRHADQVSDAVRDFLQRAAVNALQPIGAAG